MSNRLMGRERKRGAFIRGSATNRPKSFKTKEAAEKHAKVKGYKKYTIRNLKVDHNSTPKFIVKEN